MTLVLDATPGGASANSFCTVARANAILEGRLRTTAWDNAESKEAALVMATQFLCNAYVWNGYPTSTTQALSFPRSGLVDRNGFPIQGDVIPTQLEEATAEAALQLLTSDPFAVSQTVAAGLTALSAGSVSLQFDLASSQGSALRAVLNTLKVFIPPHWYTNQSSIFLVRA